MNNPAIQCEQLSVSFQPQNGTDVTSSENNGLRHISLRIAQGEKVVLTGPSGCGKSTLLKAILGLVEVDSGDIFIQGSKVTPQSIWQLRQQIAYVGQEPDPGAGPVGQLLRQPLEFKANRNLAFNDSAISNLLQRLALPASILEKEVRQLSGGERQRITLIQVLLLNRSVYLFDELTSALDGENKQIVTDYLLEQKDLTVIAISHDLSVFEKWDRIIHWPELRRGNNHD